MQLAQAQAQLADLATGKRPPEIAVVEAQLRDAEAKQRAPVTGQVQDTFYRTGEWAAPGQPVVSILPAENIKVRFFVPETRLGGLKTGQTVQVNCDGCPKPLPATIRFISSTAGYTPPVLYSEANRHRLVYLVEAWPHARDAACLHPGQPVDVSLHTD